MLQFLIPLILEFTEYPKTIPGLYQANPVQRMGRGLQPLTWLLQSWVRGPWGCWVRADGSGSEEITMKVNALGSVNSHLRWSPMVWTQSSGSTSDLEQQFSNCLCFSSPLFVKSLKIQLWAQHPGRSSGAVLAEATSVTLCPLIQWEKLEGGCRSKWVNAACPQVCSPEPLSCWKLCREELYGHLFCKVTVEIHILRVLRNFTARKMV